MWVCEGEGEGEAEGPVEVATNNKNPNLRMWGIIIIITLPGYPT